LQVAGDGDGLVESLRALPGLVNVRRSGEGLFEIETSPGTDGRAKIAQTVVNGGWELLELHRDKASLEEIFLELTKNEKALAKAEGEA
jgi:ABC-2 type transport system ATP-binding protein